MVEYIEKFGIKGVHRKLDYEWFSHSHPEIQANTWWRGNIHTEVLDRSTLEELQECVRDEQISPDNIMIVEASDAIIIITGVDEPDFWATGLTH